MLVNATWNGIESNQTNHNGSKHQKILFRLTQEQQRNQAGGADKKTNTSYSAQSQSITTNRTLGIITTTLDQRARWIKSQVDGQESAGLLYRQPHGYAEVKSASQGNSNFLICQDLLRIVMFCKNALDTQNMEGVLGVQVFGRTIAFYVLVLPLMGLYVTRELAKIKVPDCLDDSTKLVMDMPHVLLILDVFNRVCIPSLDPSMTNRHCLTITSAALNYVFSKFQDSNQLKNK